MNSRPAWKMYWDPTGRETNKMLLGFWSISNFPVQMKDLHFVLEKYTLPSHHFIRNGEFQNRQLLQVGDLPGLLVYLTSETKADIAESIFLAVAKLHQQTVVFCRPWADVSEAFIFPTFLLNVYMCPVSLLRSLWCTHGISKLCSTYKERQTESVVNQGAWGWVFQFWGLCCYKADSVSNNSPSELLVCISCLCVPRLYWNLKGFEKKTFCP